MPEVRSTRNYTIKIDDILIEPLRREDEKSMVEIIRRNLQDFEEAGTVLAATFRRLERLYDVYQGEGAHFFVAKDKNKNGICIGGVGVGTLHGLPYSERMGEVRDLVLEHAYRGLGIGARLLKRCLDQAESYHFKRLYLESTPQMQNAQKLFLRYGFKPIQDQGATKGQGQVPSYFVLDYEKVKSDKA